MIFFFFKLQVKNLWLRQSYVFIASTVVGHFTMEEIKLSGSQLIKILSLDLLVLKIWKSTLILGNLHQGVVAWGFW